MKKNFLPLIVLLVAFIHLGTSQDSSSNELNFGVYQNYPSLSMTKEKLMEADSLTHLNKYYKLSWVREYISVEVEATKKGTTKKAVGKSDVLTQEQKDLLKLADEGTDVLVKIKYMPENTLSHNDPKEFHFTFSIDPENDAAYPGGEQQLKQYLKEKAIDKIADGSFRQYQLAAVKFTIDEKGQVINPHIFWTSEDKKTDELLLETICNMPNWKPATYANGFKVKQEFVFTVGDMKSCVVNLLNIRRENDGK